MYMIEHESNGDIEDISQRLIPEIPGVTTSPDDEEESWGDLTDDVDDESEEDLIDEINKEVKSLLTRFGIEGINAAPQAEVVRLWERMGMDNYLLADLALYSRIDTQRVFKDMLRSPKFKELKEISEIAENPYDVRLKLVEHIAPNLHKIGYSELKSYRLPRGHDEDLALAFKVEGWLAGLSFMQDLPAHLRSARAGVKDHKLSQANVFKVTMEEIIRQARIAESKEVKDQYDFRLESNLEAYDRMLASIRNAYQIADSAFSKYIPK